MSRPRKAEVVAYVLEPVKLNEHTAQCRWPKGDPCRLFSTDGTRLGAEIAHEMGTTDEDEIKRRAAVGLSILQSDIEAEQADWEEGE